MADGGNGPSSQEIGLTQKDLGLATKANRPGGPLQERPVEINGIFYDPLNPPKKIRNSDGTEGYIGGRKLEQEEIDDIYAARYWEKNKSKIPYGLKETMRDQINKAVNELGGSFGLFVDPKGPSETDKEKMSAHRQMVREMGFNVSGFKMNREHHTVTAIISRPSTSKS